MIRNDCCGRLVGPHFFFRLLHASVRCSLAFACVFAAGREIDPASFELNRFASRGDWTIEEAAVTPSSFPIRVIRQGETLEAAGTCPENADGAFLALYHLHSTNEYWQISQQSKIDVAAGKWQGALQIDDSVPSGQALLQVTPGLPLAQLKRDHPRRKDSGPGASELLEVADADE